jgi:hypothetical protein
MTWPEHMHNVSKPLLLQRLKIFCSRAKLCMIVIGGDWDWYNLKTIKQNRKYEVSIILIFRKIWTQSAGETEKSLHFMSFCILEKTSVLY